MAKLSVNLNKVATLRNTRDIGIPSVTRAARICLDAGADGITVHPRPDARHIRKSDVLDLAELLVQWPDRELNIEGNPFEGDYLALVERVRPTQCTLVPDAPNAFTSSEGWSIERDGARLEPIVSRLARLPARVSLFMDAASDELAGVRALGAHRVELYTQPYAEAHARGDFAGVLETFAAAAHRAAAEGLGVNAGHDLNLDNLPAFIRAVPGVLEVSIGHALVADALELGLAETVRRYRVASGG